MKLKSFRFLLALLSAVIVFSMRPSDAEAPAAATTAPARKIPLPTQAEARARAQLLHAALHGSLMVIHRDFFRRDLHKIVPSEAMKDVFKDLAGDWGVEVRWVAGDETLMNGDNKARDAFEQKALAAMSNGDKEFEAVENGRFRYMGQVVLQNQCLKCHTPNRKTLEDRYAGLAISLPLAPAVAP